VKFQQQKSGGNAEKKAAKNGKGELFTSSGANRKTQNKKLNSRAKYAQFYSARVERHQEKNTR